MTQIIEEMRRYANVPIMAKPNAGLPKLIDGQTVYDMGAEEFSSFGPALVEAGAAMIGGCCGTTPEHICKLREKTASIRPLPLNTKRKRVLASERQIREIDIGWSVFSHWRNVSIRPGKKQLQASLREGSMDIVIEMAEQQEEMGADILDVNMGMNGIDEKEMMLQAIEEIYACNEPSSLY